MIIVIGHKTTALFTNTPELVNAVGNISKCAFKYTDLSRSDLHLIVDKAFERYLKDGAEETADE